MASKYSLNQETFKCPSKRAEMIWEKLLLRWMSGYLTTDVTKLLDLSDGKVLNELLTKLFLVRYIDFVKKENIYTTMKLGKILKGKNQHDAHDSGKTIQKCVQFVKTIGDIPDKKLMISSIECGGPLVLDLLDQISEKFYMQHISVYDHAFRDIFLQWINKYLSPSYKAINTGEDWRSGIRLGALINALTRGLCKDYHRWDPDNGVGNVTRAMAVCHQHFEGIHQILEANDFVYKGTPARCIQLYLSQFITAKVKRGTLFCSVKYVAPPGSFAIETEDIYTEIVHPDYRLKLPPSSPPPLPPRKRDCAVCGSNVAGIYSKDEQIDQNTGYVDMDVIYSETDDLYDETGCDSDSNEPPSTPQDVNTDAVYEIPQTPTKDVSTDQEAAAIDYEFIEYTEQYTVEKKRKLQKAYKDHSRLELEDMLKLQQGDFAKVFKGRFMDPDRGYEIVAVKMAKDTAMGDKLVNEALLMMDFKHPNVMSLYGFAVKNEIPWIILPWMENGDVLSFIRRKKDEITLKRLLTFNLDVLDGMMYLSDRGFIHRDLAARNCLVDRRYRVKVSDLTLTRDVFHHEYIQASTMGTSFRWAAIEALKYKRYTPESDVWSFAVLWWELLTVGRVPYEELVEDPAQMAFYLMDGNRLEQPQRADNDMYRMMSGCWDNDPSKRPTFPDLHEYLERQLSYIDPDYMSDIEAPYGFSPHRQIHSF